MVHQYPLSPELEELLVATERLDHIRDHFLQALHLLLTVTGARPNVQPPEELSALTQPVQLIWGKADPFGDVDLGPCGTTYPESEFEVVIGGTPLALRFKRDRTTCRILPQEQSDVAGDTSDWVNPGRRGPAMEAFRSLGSLIRSAVTMRQQQPIHC